MSEKTPNLTAREIAVMVAAFVEDHCGQNCSDPAVLDGMWLAMQMVGGPGPAAAAMRYCGVNFANK